MPHTLCDVDTRHLIDEIVRQTTLLIAQLATAGGVRAPLAHIADEVFLELAREIEHQGVSRNVVADMFGMALRTYQKKVNRLQQSITRTEQTLWESVLHYVRERNGATRTEVLAAFSQDDERHVIAVLGDLVSSGLLYGTGRGKHAAYGPVPDREVQRLSHERAVEQLAHAVWLEIALHPGLTRNELTERFDEHAVSIDDALASLTSDARIEIEPGTADPVRYRTTRVFIAADSEAGWETAVLDHFRAVCTAVASKLREGGAMSPGADRIGGSTLRFDVYSGHPHELEVLDLLPRIRENVFEIWSRVAEHNRTHPVPEDHQQVVFYFGQTIIEPNRDAEASP